MKRSSYNLPSSALLLSLVLFVNTSIGFIPSPAITSYTIKRTTTTTSLSVSNLKGNVCVVTGASRGIGRGIAIELGKAGATVYVTGTSSKTTKPSPSSPFVTNEEVGGVGTIEETAQRITEEGGKGIPVYCDHSDDAQVQALFDKVQKDSGRLDLLVNNAFRVPSGLSGLLEGNFWEQGPQVWDAMHTVGLRSHYVASCYAVPVMLQNPKRVEGDNASSLLPRPMIAMVSSFGGMIYTFNVAYGVGKAGVDRLAKDMSVELNKHDISVCSFWPGVVLTERMQEKVDDGEWDDKVGIPLDNVESPGFTGKGIIAVATDAENMEKSGSVQIVAELSTEYGFKDENDRQPASIRSLKFLLPNYAMDENMKKVFPDWLIPDWKIPISIMAQGRPDQDRKV